MNGEWSDFRWIMYGKKRLKNNILRVYYNCKERSSGCLACLRKDFLCNPPNKSKLIKTLVKDSHNHPKPQNPKVLDTVARSVKQKLQLGLKPIEIEKQCILEAEEASPKWCPSREQVRSWRTYLRSKDLPSKDSLQNIVSMFRDSFLLELMLFPTIRIICGTAEGIKYLCENGDFILIDGTFELTELFGIKLNLTTIMVPKIGLELQWHGC